MATATSSNGINQDDSTGASGAAVSTLSEEETTWTDDRIRWTEEENTRCKNASDDESAGVANIFQDADPFAIFPFHFRRPSGFDNAVGEVIDIDIRGYKSDSDQVWQSTGVTLWRASEHLCKYLLNHDADLLQGRRRILELGAGLGLVGILVHRMNDTSTVCLTDGDTDALEHLRANVARNQCNQSCDSISCHQLLWGSDTADKFRAKHGTFDVIVASDIVYAPCVIEPLWETVQTLLSQPDGVFVMAFALREVPVTIGAFIAVAHGFSCECVETNETEGLFVYEFRWNKG